jgi:xylulokinase
VLEGICFEVEGIRQAAQGLTGESIGELYVVGGGSKNAAWVQIKADVTGCVCHVPELPEATALGAALCAGLGVGALAGTDDLAEIADGARRAGSTTAPDRERHSRYRTLYENGYRPLQEPLRAYAGRVWRSGQAQRSSR